MSDNSQLSDSASSTSSPASSYSELSVSESDVTDALSSAGETVYLPHSGHNRHHRHRSSGSRSQLERIGTLHDEREDAGVRSRLPVAFGASPRGATQDSSNPDVLKAARTAVGSQHTRTLHSIRTRRPRSRSHHRHDDPGMPRLHVSRDFLLIIGLCITLACAVVLVTRPAVTAIYDGPYA